MLLTILCHGLAMLGMALLLLPGMPGGLSHSTVERVQYVATHPVAWRLGWAGWQATAASDLVLAIALLVTPWIPKWPAMLTLVATLAAVVPDQVAQYQWSLHGPAIAVAAVHRSACEIYLTFESHCFHGVAAVGTIGYLLGAFGWTWCFAAAGTWSRRLTQLSIVTWTLFAAATAVMFLPTAWVDRLSGAVSVGNAVAFVLLMVWLVMVTERVLRRARPDTTVGGLAPWRFPTHHGYTAPINTFANSRLARQIGRLLPALAMRSEITDVIYINYLLPADRLSTLAPSPLQLQIVANNQAVLSVLMFRHGHFGPRCFGKLRKLWPSPLQSNWRVYVTDPTTGLPGVYFVTTTITSIPHAFATRLLCDGVPMHVPAAATLDVVGTAVKATIDPGIGSAPDLRVDLVLNDLHELPTEWLDVFASRADSLRYLVPQDRALDSLPWTERINRQEIDLRIPLESCRWMMGTVESGYVSKWTHGIRPLCFLVPAVEFEFAKAESRAWDSQ